MSGFRSGLFVLALDVRAGYTLPNPSGTVTAERARTMTATERMELSSSMWAHARSVVVMKLLAGPPHDLDDADAIGRRRSLDEAEVEGLVDAIAGAITAGRS